LSLVALGLVLTGAVVQRVAPDPAALTDALIDWVKDETGRDLTIAGGLGLSLLPYPALVIDGASLAGAPLIRVARAEVGVQPWALLRGRVEPTKIRLTGVHIALVRGRDGSGNWGPITQVGAELVGPMAPNIPVTKQTPPAMPPAGSAVLPVPRSGSLGGTVSRGGSGVGGLRLDGIELLDSTLIWEDQGSGRTLALRDLHLTTGPLQPGVPVGLTLAAGLGLAGAGTDARISVSARLGLEDGGGEGGALVVTDMRVQITDLPATEGLARPLELTGKLRAQANMAIRLDLAMNELDLDAYLSRLGRAAGAAGPGRIPSGHDDLPGQPQPADLGNAVSLPLAEVPAFPAGLPPAPNLDGHLTVGRLRAVGLELREVEITAMADGGLLRLDHRVADFYGGGLAGTLDLDLRGREPQVKLQTAALGFQAGPLLADLTGTGGLAGRGDLSVSVATAGLDPATLKRALQGTFALRLGEGALVGVDLDALIEGAVSAVAGRPAQGQAMGEIPRTVFYDLSATAVAADGVLRSDNLIVHGPWFQATGTGTLGLVNGRMDARLLPVLVKPPRGRGLKELEGIPIRVTVTGTLATPIWHVDLAPALREVARRKLDGRGDNLIRDLDRRSGLKGLGDMLRGLLGH
jgi:AsmA protein